MIMVRCPVFGICRHVFPLDRDGTLQIDSDLKFFVMILLWSVTVFRKRYFAKRSLVEDD